MKTTTSLVAILAFSFSAITMGVANSETINDGVSVLSKPVIQDEAVPPTPGAQDAVAPVAVPEEGAIESPSVMMDSIVMGEPMQMAPAGGCQTCGVAPCCCTPPPTCCPTRCCPPPPTPMVFCLTDPCGCTHEACVKVPACCAGQQPCITWKNGIFGRQIATLCWNCCDHEVKVTVTRRGKVRVRG